MTAEFQKLKQFFGAYFHQDWDLDGDTWTEVLESYLDENTVEEASRLIGEMKLLVQLQKQGNIAGDAFLKDAGCSYDYTNDGISALEWTSQLLETLKVRTADEKL